MKDFTSASLASALACLFATLAVAVHLYTDTPAPALPPAQIAEAPATLPRILSAADRLTYRRIFALQEKGESKAANQLISHLQNRILLGASKEAKRSDARITPPIRAAAVGNAQSSERFGSALINRHLKGSPLRAEIRRRLIAGNRAQALAILGSTKNVAPRDYDLLRWYIAGSFFNHGEYHQAALLAKASATRSGKEFPELHWIAGIAEWHQGNIQSAYTHFAAMAGLHAELSNTDAAAAAFWAYRAANKLGDNQKATHYLQRAALHPDTFYGIQASKALERELALHLTTRQLNASDIKHLIQRPHIARIIALSEIGKHAEAEQELQAYYLTAPASEQPKLLSLAVMLDLPAIQIHLALDLKKKGLPPLNYALYPTPDLRPRNGYAVDPALIFAIARQESGFNTKARSHAGASGLMQLMPETARYLLSRANHRGNLQAQMQDPATSIALGQQYIHHLQQQPAIGDNLVYMLAAYNAGPSPLINWQQQLSYKNDPLLFVESIPFVETRGYILSVLTNYWIYNEIIDSKNASVHAMLEGKWPLYQTSKQEIASAADSLQQRAKQKDAL